MILDSSLLEETTMILCFSDQIMDERSLMHQRTYMV